ncbi:hypothetical protein GQ600_25468 [Phytophthora cactorum]|nr:hypothetical protein GQ600_25468 [Phytophthora cactorum]
MFPTAHPTILSFMDTTKHETLRYVRFIDYRSIVIPPTSLSSCTMSFT